MTQHAERLGERALVLGGSLAGLLAARAVAPHFDEVILVDRAAFDGGPAPRMSAPQTFHLHVLLKGGEQAMEALAPGFLARLEASGSVPLDPGHDFFSRFRAGRCQALLRRPMPRPRPKPLAARTLPSGPRCSEGTITSPSARAKRCGACSTTPSARPGRGVPSRLGGAKEALNGKSWSMPRPRGSPFPCLRPWSLRPPWKTVSNSSHTTLVPWLNARN
jgi:hypothetical protein